MGVGVENLDAGLGNQGQVLYADAGAAGEVDARLDRERHARLCDLLVDKGNVAWLVVLQADRVAQAMREVLAVASVLNHVARGAVQVAHAHARGDERLCGFVGAAHDVVDVYRLLVRLAPKERACHVRAVVAIASANVE